LKRMRKEEEEEEEEGGGKGAGLNSRADPGSSEVRIMESFGN